MIASAFVLALLSLTPGAVANPFEQILGKSFEKRQNLQAVQNSINAIGTNLAAANNSVVAFQDGGLAGITGLTSVNDAVVKLGDALTTATNAATQTPRLSPTDSTTVGISFLFLQPNINQLLGNLGAKRSQFDNAAFGILDVRSLIHDSLVIQQNASQALGQALINVLDPTLAGIAQPINDQIQGNFTATIDEFQGRSGVIKIPTVLVPTISNLLASLGDSLGGLLGGLGSNSSSLLDSVETNLNARQDTQYCCGITQAQLDQLGPDQDDLANVPEPVINALKAVGLIQGP